MTTSFKIRNCKDLEKRSRYWAFLLYPESCNPDYLRILKESGMKVAISPLHDQDVYIDGEHKGELQKPHYHCLTIFGGGYKLSSFDYILEDIKAFNTVEIVKDPAAYHDYQFHKTNDDKASYNEDDIIYINSTRYDYVQSEYKEIINFINDYELTSFKALVNKLIKEQQDKLLVYVSKNAYYVNMYLSDKHFAENLEFRNLLADIADRCDNIDGYNDDRDSIDWEIKNIKRMCTDYELC